MKIIKIKDIQIIYKDFHEYTIKTPIGVFKDINDAVKCYPYLKDDGRNIKRCGYCGKYFIKAGRKDAARKYCSKKCSDAYNTINKREINRMWTRDKYLRDKTYNIVNDYLYHKQNPEYTENDTFWGLGSSHLGEHAQKDHEHEHNIIKKELRRYHLINS